MSMGGPWSTSTPASVARKNKTSVITMSGDELETLDKTLYKIVTCNESGGQFEIHHTYYFGDDGSTVVDLTELINHSHSNSNSGGSMVFILKDNSEVLDLYLSQPIHFQDSQWNNTVTGTGSLEFDQGGGSSKPYIRLRPNGTSGSGATISYTNAQNLSFASPSTFVGVGNFETATSLAFHAGVNADDVTAADSNTIKYQAEVCTATNNNWFLRTANGTNNSASDTGAGIGTSDDSIKIFHDPTDSTPYAEMEIDDDDYFLKTTHIPVSGINTTGNLLKFSIKNSTASDRPYRFKGARLSFITADVWGY